MAMRDAPIRRKLMTMILLTSGLVLLLTSAAFVTYEFLTFRQSSVRQLSTLGEIIAANSTAALAFDNPDDAKETLAALKAERHIVAATLYDRSGKLFARYPDRLSDDALPAAPGPDGYRFEHTHLIGFEPVVQGSNSRLGTLYLESDMGAMYERLRLYGGIAVLVMAGSFLVAYLLSRKLQQEISHPILALAETAQAVSDRRDYSVRAAKVGQDELGLLTDAFNHMLAEIQGQNQALTESESRVRSVLNSALTAVVVTDASGVITDWNTRAETMFGLSRAEAIGRPLEEAILPARHGDAHQRAVERSLAGAPDGGTTPTIEMSAWRRNHGEFPVELSVSVLRKGGVVTYCNFLTDITERQLAERKLHTQLARLDLINRITRAIGERLELQSIFEVVVRNLEENVPIDFGCVCLYDGVNQLLTVAGGGGRDRPQASALGLTDQTAFSVTGNDLSRCLQGHLVYESDTRRPDSAFSQRFASQGLRSLVVAPLVVESQVFGVLIAARRDPESFASADCEFLRQLSGHVALGAHQAQIYGALQQAYDDLRQSQQVVLQQERLRALGQMASGIAHDINNAISPCALYTQALLESEPNLSPRAREYLETIDRSIDDVAGTVARMREFYRQRGPELSLGPTSFNTLVEQILHLTSARWSDMPQQRGVVIETRTDLEPNLPPVMAAEGEIREALTNLVFNAVDAMPEGGTLTIRTRMTQVDSDDEPPLRRVHLEVSDTGHGMDDEARRRCLEPFFTTKGERGTGLGLAMVYGMVQRHSAEIEIESEPRKGTTVRLTFAAPAVAETREADATTHAVPSRLRILVVDDDPLLLRSLRDTLELDGHAIVTANGGQEGISAFQSGLKSGAPFMAVITDLGMPYVDGRQVSSAVKHASPDTPVIMLTGWGQRMAAEGEVPPFVDRVLSKPPKLRELRDALAHFTQPTRP